MFIYSILLIIIHTATYTSKMLPAISFNKMVIFIFIANLPYKLIVFTTYFLLQVISDYKSYCNSTLILHVTSRSPNLIFVY